MPLKAAQRWLPVILLSLAFILCLTRFAWLHADFPNHSPWMRDSAKYTDEGWWANAAVRHFLVGHWEVAGDYNPAVAVPVWPALLAMVFQFTGVSIMAARAVNVGFSAATVALVYLLIRRYGGTQTTAAVAAVLLAASPFAFAFSRVATLDTMVVFEWVLLLWVTSYADRERYWPLAVLGLLLGAMVLTKTTSLALLPSILWLVWKKNLRAVLTVSTLAGAVLGIYFLLVLRSRYAGDYHYFFNINALADVELKRTGSLLQQLFRNCLWVGHILYPASLVVLVLSVIWLRKLWRNPLFAASWIAFAGNAVYILRRQDDYSPRYFLVMLVPSILVLVLALQELEIRHRGLAMLLAATLTVAVILDTGQIFNFLAHRQYQFYEAAKSIQATVNADPRANRLLLGTSADQISLMTGVPAINDAYSSQDLTEKLSHYQAGWYVSWNDLDQDILESLTDFRLDEVASYPVFDHEDRNRLKLYRMVPLKDEHK
jgi:4-amino-4-deoxy-L-arabinose transferase-like glycosyltransferase